MGASVTKCIAMLNNTYQKAHFDKQARVWRRSKAASTYTHILMPRLFIFRIWQLCSVYWDLEIWGSTTATIWRSAAVQQEGSYTPRPTTGCFSINKDFLLSTEVPTDAFIGAKFTLCTRRELPLCCSEWRCSSDWAFSCLSCSWASQNNVSLSQQGSFCTLTSEAVGLYLKLNDELVAMKCRKLLIWSVVSFWDFTAAGCVTQ